jgi:hypothetical protein
MYRKTLTGVFFPWGKATQFIAWKGDEDNIIKLIA